MAGSLHIRRGQLLLDAATFCSGAGAAAFALATSCFDAFAATAGVALASGTLVAAA